MHMITYDFRLEKALTLTNKLYQTILPEKQNVTN